MKLPIFLVAITFFHTGCSGNSESTTGNADNDVTPTDVAIDDDTQSDSVPISTITSNNTNELILQAFEVLTARAYDARLTVFPYTNPIDVPANYGEKLTVRRLAPRSCNNAGQAHLIPDVSGDTYQVQANYSDCLVGFETLNGHVILIEDRNYNQSDLNDLHTHAREFSDEFSVKFEPDGLMNVNGLYKFKPATSSSRAVGVENFNYDFNYPGGRLTVSDATTIRTVRLDGKKDNLGHKAYMSGEFRMRPPFLNGSEVSVTVTEPFINENTPTQLSYERGVMRISDSENELVITANNGNADTVSITSTVNGGTPITREEPWSAWTAALAFEAPELTSTIPTNPTTSRQDVIRADNYADILTEVFRVFNGDHFASDILALPHYPFPEFEPGFLQPNTLDGLGDLITMSCTNGGSAHLQPYKWGSRQIVEGWNTQFDACDHDGMRYEGSFFTRNFGNFNYGSLDGLSVTSENSAQNFKGVLDYKHTNNRDGAPTVWYDFHGDYKMSDNRGDYELRDAAFFFGAVYTRTTLVSGHFFLKTPVTSNEFLNIQTLDPIVYEVTQQGFEEDYFEWGTLAVSAGNGNRLTLKLNNGDDDTFIVEVDQPGQPTLRETLSWSDWKNQLSFKFDLHRRQ